jgi:hypothetical protein
MAGTELKFIFEDRASISTCENPGLPGHFACRFAAALLAFRAREIRASICHHSPGAKRKQWRTGAKRQAGSIAGGAPALQV